MLPLETWRLRPETKLCGSGAPTPEPWFPSFLFPGISAAHIWLHLAIGRRENPSVGNEDFCSRKKMQITFKTPPTLLCSLFPNIWMLITQFLRHMIHTHNPLQLLPKPHSFVLTYTYIPPSLPHIELGQNRFSLFHPEISTSCSYFRYPQTALLKKTLTAHLGSQVN
jgi:hypothetical protein